MATNYTTKTASLKATMADIRKVEATKIMVSPDGKASSQKKDLVELIGEKSNISVGRDADKNWSVDEQAIDAVKKISFLGDYVNVVPGENGEVKLYIGENKSLEEADRTALDVTLPNTSKVLFYTDDTENHALPTGVTANSTEGNAVVVTDGTSYGSTKFTAKGGTFTADQTDCIWVRTTYDYGTPSAWGKVSLTINRGTYNRNTTSPTESSVTTAAVTVDTEKGEVALPSGVTMNVGNYILTAEADAQYGKVPGRCETAYDFTVNWATIATKGGGHIKVEWGFGSANEAGTAPSDAVTIKYYERYFTEKKDVAMAANSLTAVIDATVLSPAVSGLKYNTSGTTIKVNTGNITNSQYKTAASTKRLNITAAGKSVDYTTADLTLVSGTITKSDAVYKATDKIVTLSTTGTGTAEVKATPYGYAAGTAQTKTIANFWGSVPTSTATKENFGVESGTGGYRMKTPASTTVDFVSTEDVTTHSIDVNGTTCCSAVCQYGKLYHPASAAADAEGKSYSTTLPACFIRTFTGSSKPNTFKLEGINLIQSNKVQIWWKDGGNWYDLSTAVTGSVAHSNAADGKSDTITKTILTADGETSRTDMLIAIVVQPGAAYIGPITATFA